MCYDVIQNGTLTTFCYDNDATVSPGLTWSDLNERHNQYRPDDYRNCAYTAYFDPDFYDMNHILMECHLVGRPPSLFHDFGQKPDGNEDIFDGVSWDEMSYRWHRPWWDYPCIYYTEEAFLVATDHYFRYARVPCDDKFYHWYNNEWYVTSNERPPKDYSYLYIARPSQLSQYVYLDDRLNAFFQYRPTPLGKTHSLFVAIT